MRRKGIAPRRGQEHLGSKNKEMFHKEGKNNLPIGKRNRFKKRASIFQVSRKGEKDLFHKEGKYSIG